MLGSCDANSNRVGTPNTEASNLAVKVLGNPSRSYFNLQIGSLTNKNVRITVYDNLGRLVETKSQSGDQIIKLGSSYKPGSYVVEIVQGTQKQTLRLLKTN
jgi:hypothetical protein